MKSNKKLTYDLTDSFGDDFEVKYEEDSPITYKLEPKPAKRKKKKPDLSVVDVNTDYLYTIPDEEVYDEDEDYDEEEYYDEEPAYHHSSKKRKRRSGVTPLAAPIKKSGKAVYNIAYTILHNLSVLLILAIIIYMSVNFLRGSAPYGDLIEEIQTRDFSQMLVSYYGFTACLILFELLSALWAMTKERVRDEYGRHKEDVGRGLFSFIFTYVCSYACFLLSNHIPELNLIAQGMKGAAEVFGSMHNVLFGLCAAGVISCLIRKYRL
ncbi:MAG: hypothetical protein J5983_04495 [Ruminococcus sp.]|nr:hypothetical protein [Ruminococcus sp.]